MERVLEEFKRKYWKKIRKKPNVSGYSGVLHPRIKDGKEIPGTRCIRIYVERKVPLCFLSPKERIPRQLELGGSSIETDIVVLPRIRFMDSVVRTTPEEHQKRYRPAPAGVSCIHKDGTACTIDWYFRKGDKVLVALNNHCLPKGSMVLSNPGFKDISEAETVIGLDGNLQDVIKHFKRTYNGDLIVIKPRFLEAIKLTPEHPVLAIRPEKVYRYTYREYPVYHKPFKPEWVPASDIRKWDILLIPKIKREINNQLEISKELAYFLGMYVAEGSCSWSTKHSVTVKITITSKEIFEKLVSRASKVFDNIHVDSYKNNGKQFYSLKIYSVALAEQLTEWFGSGARNKKLPNFIYHLPDEVLDSFIEGMIDGDGWRTKERIGYSTSSEQLKQDMILLWLLKGKVPGVSYWEGEQEYLGYRWKSRKWNIIVYLGRKKDYYEDERFFYVPVREVYNEHYSGEVYNLQTRDETYAVPFIVHNCGSLENTAKIGDEWLQPSPYDGGQYPDDTIAKLAFYVPTKYNGYKCPYRNFAYKLYKGLYYLTHFRPYEAVNYVDISFGEPINPEDLSFTIYGIEGKVIGKGEHRKGIKVYKAGRTTAVTEGIIDDPCWNGYVYGRRGTAWYEDCVLVKGKCAGGDSGSPTVSITDEGLLYHGALFAGSDQGDWVYCKVENIERIAGVELVTI